VPAKTLFVGLDAGDPRLIERFAREGKLPSFEALAHDAAVYELASPMAVIGGGVWEELNLSRSCGRVGVFFPGRQLHTGESVPRQVEADEVDPRAFWTVASDAGKRVAVVDVPHAVSPGRLNGVFVSGWGSHDRFYAAGSIPAGLLSELDERHGPYPLWSRPWPRRTTAACDGHDGTTEQYEQLLDDLLDGVERKSALLLDVLGREDWDLFACGLSEAHCIGHQLWHFLDGSAPEGHERLVDGVALVYQRLDSALKALVDAAGPSATVFVVGSHSFCDPTGGYQLIPDVLARLGYASGGVASARARSRVPPSVRRLVRRALPRRATQTLQARVGTLPHPLDSPSTKVVALSGDECGWIRLNLEGREPHGAVQPGPEADEILADVRQELLQLEQPDTGERIVTRVLTPAEAFGGDHHPDVPDLLVNFRTDLGVLDACSSSRVGLVGVPLVPTVRRTGAHPPVPATLWITGDDVAAPATAGEGYAVDLAPTILATLGVAAPEWMEGAPLGSYRLDGRGVAG
jgi:predicted AlkP superfamily phosphohydrolase/phosphomutase